MQDLCLASFHYCSLLILAGLPNTVTCSRRKEPVLNVSWGVDVLFLGEHVLMVHSALSVYRTASFTGYLSGRQPGATLTLLTLQACL